MLESIQPGEARTHRGIVIVPLFPRRDPVAPYITLNEALPLGLKIAETSDAGSVPELVVHNPLDKNVLLYDGEELVGAKQNRILNVTVLVAAGAQLPIPVSCVEQGRWSRQSVDFNSAGHVSHAHLRRRKAELLAAQPLARGIAQGEVWDEVREKAMRMHVQSDTGANSDTFAAHRGRLEELEAAFPLEPGQCGAVLALGDQLCLDSVSRPEAFVQLWPKLRRGYLLDALERLDGGPTDAAQIGGFLDQVREAPASEGVSAGLGMDVRLRGSGVIGSGLRVHGEIVQLSAFSSEDGGKRAFGRIARPSQRR